MLMRQQGCLEEQECTVLLEGMRQDDVGPAHGHVNNSCPSPSNRRIAALETTRKGARLAKFSIRRPLVQVSSFSLSRSKRFSRASLSIRSCTSGSRVSGRRPLSSNQCALTDADSWRVDPEMQPDKAVVQSHTIPNALSVFKRSARSKPAIDSMSAWESWTLAACRLDSRLAVFDEEGMTVQPC
jgi:hypothetical protein